MGSVGMSEEKFSIQKGDHTFESSGHFCLSGIGSSSAVRTRDISEAEVLEFAFTSMPFKEYYTKQTRNWN